MRATIPNVEEKRTPSLSESLENSGEIVAGSPTLKTLLSAIGASIDAAISGSPAPFGTALSMWVVARADEIEKRRIEEQFVLLLQQLQTLEGQVVRRDFFETEEGRDMLIKVLDEGRRTRSRLKKELYARILKGAILDFEKREYSSEEYLYLTSDLTEREMEVALSIYEGSLSLNQEDWKTWAGKVKGQVGMDFADLGFALGRLVSAGLLYRVSTVEEGEHIAFVEPDENELGFYQVTPGFKKLMRFMGQEE